MKRQRNFDSLKRMVRNSEVADFDRVVAWARSHPRKPAVLAFTAGPERQAAYWIEWTERQYVANGGGEGRAIARTHPPPCSPSGDRP